MTLRQKILLVAAHGLWFFAALASVALHFRATSAKEALEAPPAKPAPLAADHAVNPAIADHSRDVWSYSSSPGSLVCRAKPVCSPDAHTDLAAHGSGGANWALNGPRNSLSLASDSDGEISVFTTNSVKFGPIVRLDFGCPLDEKPIVTVTPANQAAYEAGEVRVNASPVGFSFRLKRGELTDNVVYSWRYKVEKQAGKKQVRWRNADGSDKIFTVDNSSANYVFANGSVVDNSSANYVITTGAGGTHGGARP